MDAALGFEACKPVCGVSFLQVALCSCLQQHIDHLTALGWIGAPVEISNLASVFDARACLLFLLPSSKAGSPFTAQKRTFRRILLRLAAEAFFRAFHLTNDKRAISKGYIDFDFGPGSNRTVLKHNDV
ncbi:hypothetical protein HFO89_34250 [Rhizobium leguminosarum]|uniref:hypothetical protein n=1 Tax=Rhizobium leguminosarum TaxID=384 RepID=UPI001C955132|nr:hypothetical protein [Rhizobium leguminosarum]MBY5461313.1 hypothetical protein [Rhizobium leguminosarum]